MAAEQKSVTRRGFGRALARSGVAAAAAGPIRAQAPAQTGAGPAAPAAATVPNDQIVFAGIGIRTRGMYDLTRLIADPRVRFVGIADVRESARENVKSFVDKHYQNNDCKMYRDPAEILARLDIDALLIATSDRWHGPMA